MTRPVSYGNLVFRVVALVRLNGNAPFILVMQNSQELAKVGSSIKVGEWEALFTDPTHKELQ